MRIYISLEYIPLYYGSKGKRFNNNSVLTLWTKHEVRYCIIVSWDFMDAQKHSLYKEEIWDNA